MWLKLIQSKQGIRLKRHNGLYRRHLSIIILDAANPIHHHTYQVEFLLKELLDGHMCTNVNTSTEICRQFTLTRGLTFQPTNYVPDYTIGHDCGLLIKSDEVMNAVSSNLDLRELKVSTVSSLFDLWSLSDTLSRIYPYPLPNINILQDSVNLQSLICDSIT
jgi:hypothetical protein